MAATGDVPDSWEDEVPDSWEDAVDDVVPQTIEEVKVVVPDATPLRAEQPAEALQAPPDKLDALSRLEFQTESDVSKFVAVVAGKIEKAQAKNQSQLLLRFLILILESCHENIDADSFLGLLRQIKKYNYTKKKERNEKTFQKNIARSGHRGYASKYDADDFDDDYEEESDEDDYDD
eukprot:Selendium_serpulae@DN4567_c0_g1_i3.p1